MLHCKSVIAVTARELYKELYKEVDFVKENCSDEIGLITVLAGENFHNGTYVSIVFRDTDGKTCTDIRSEDEDIDYGIFKILCCLCKWFPYEHEILVETSW